MRRQLAPRVGGRVEGPVAAAHPWITALTAGTVAVLTAAMTSGPVPAAAVHHVPRAAFAGRSGPAGGRPRTEPSPSASGAADDGPVNVDITPRSGNERNLRFRDRFLDDGAFRTRRHLEFTGVIGWPDFAMACHFDPDFRGADGLGRRVVCVDTLVRPPVFAHTRIRGRHFFGERRFRRRAVRPPCRTDGTVPGRPLVLTACGRLHATG